MNLNIKQLLNESLKADNTEDIFEIIKYIGENIDLNIFTEAEQDLLLNTKLFEQSYEKSNFSLRVSNVAFKIVDNLCLILYAQHYNKKLQQYINHWKVDLYSYCIKIFKATLKSGDKQKALEYIFFEKCDFNDSERIYEMISEKFLDIFSKEGIYIYSEQYAIYDVIEQFQEIIKDDLIPLMSNKHNSLNNNISAYINDL